MRPAHIDNQIRIARIAAYTLHYIGKLDDGIYNLAKSAGISEGRLGAMIRFIQTKGEPCQVSKYPTPIPFIGD